MSRVCNRVWALSVALAFALLGWGESALTQSKPVNGAILTKDPFHRTIA